MSGDQARAAAQEVSWTVLPVAPEEETSMQLGRQVTGTPEPFVATHIEQKQDEGLVMHLCAMTCYADKSPEELRWEDMQVELAKKVIAEIRQEKLVDVDVKQQVVREGIEHIKAMLQRSVDKLAHDIYSKRAHFLLELLQNADDNEYH